MRATGYLALSRQAALERDMAVIANNLANATTTGFRAEHTVFAETLQRVGSRAIAFTADQAQARDPAPGPITQTGNRLDVALDGPGYLAFAGAAGVQYGRAGRLEIDPEGRLVNMQGQALLDDSISIPTRTSASVLLEEIDGEDVVVRIKATPERAASPACTEAGNPS